MFLESNNPITSIDTSKITLVDKDTIKKPFKASISKKENKIAILFDKDPEQKYSLEILPSALSDIFEHKNDTLKYFLRTKEIEDYGRITMNFINQTSDDLIVELLVGKNKDELIERRFIKDSKKLVFKLLEPKTYFIRVIVDTNKNNIWDTGNFLLKKQPERIIYFQEELKVRANYYLDGNTFTIKKIE